MNMKELSNEIGENIIWYIIEKNIQDKKAIEVLLKHIYKHSAKFVKETLRVKRW